jgi:hypothetical protein
MTFTPQQGLAPVFQPAVWSSQGSVYLHSAWLRIKLEASYPPRGQGFSIGGICTLSMLHLSVRKGIFVGSKNHNFIRQERLAVIKKFADAPSTRKLET